MNIRDNKAALWFNRAAFAVVFAINVWCAVAFIVNPQAFAGAYELQGAAGEVAVRGMGVVFLMWNATYPLYIFKPDRFFVLGGVIIVQQVIGCIGESIILATLGAGHEILTSSILRFIAFDVGGLLLEIAAVSVLLASRKLAS